MTDPRGRHVPRPTPETAAFWDGCRERRLMIQRCSTCGHHQFYPRIICTECMSEQLEWVPAAGSGTVTSFTVARLPVSEAYAPDVPYVVALIELDEGPTMMSNVIECDPESVTISMPVEVVFEDWTDDITMPKFRPRS